MAFVLVPIAVFLELETRRLNERAVAVPSARASSRFIYPVRHSQSNLSLDN